MDNRLPIYQQLKDIFTQKICSEQWGRESAIPSEFELSGEHGVAIGTVRKAIESLVTDGYLIRQQGKGTFVRKASFGNAMFRFFRHTDDLGQVIKPSARILSMQVKEPSNIETEQLNLNNTDKIIAIHRIRYVQEEPLLYEEISLSANRFQALLVIDPTTFEDLLYPAYEQLCHVRVHRATEKISFDLASKNVAKGLSATDQEPVAVITRLASSIDGQPVEWRKSYGLASRFSYSIELK